MKIKQAELLLSCSSRLCLRSMTHSRTSIAMPIIIGVKWEYSSVSGAANAFNTKLCRQCMSMSSVSCYSDNFRCLYLQVRRL